MEFDVDEGLYRVFIEGRFDDDGCLQTLWIPAEHMGHAIHQAFIVAGELGIKGPLFACQVVPIDSDDVPVDAEHLISSGIHYHDELHTFPLIQDDDVLKFPTGIVPAVQEHGADSDDIVAGYRVDRELLPFEVELVVDGRELASVFGTLLQGLESADALEVGICDHWQGHDKTEVWLSDDWRSHQRILTYVMERKSDLLHNGYVQLGVYMREQRCTYMLDDHKTIKFFSEDVKYVDAFEEQVMKLKFHELSDFKTIERGFYHHHYRPHDSSDRATLIQRLENDGLRWVNT